MTIAAVPVRRRSGPVVAAVVLDAIALLGLLLVGAGGYLRGDALVLVFVGALLGPAIVPGVVLSSIVVARRLRARGLRKRAVAAVVAVSAIAAILVGPAVLAASWSATPNPAVGVLRPLEDEVRAIGGAEICSNGDPGLGPDNVAPWREVYYRVPSTAPLLARLTERAAASGFDLRPTRTTDSPYRGTSTVTAAQRTGRLAGYRVTAEIATVGIPLRCGADYGRTYRPEAGTVVVDLSTSGPER